MNDRKSQTQTIELDADQLDAVQGGKGGEADLKIQSERDLAEKFKLSDYSGRKTNLDKNAESIILHEEDVSL